MPTDNTMDLEFKLVELLLGKINLLQPQDEREILVLEALKTLLEKPEFHQYKSQLQTDDQQILFVKSFLSYGIVTDLLCDFRSEEHTSELQSQR